MFKSYNEEKEYDRRFEMQNMRLQTMILVNQNLKTVHQFKDPKKFLRFYWEDEVTDKIEIWSEDEWLKMDKKLGLVKDKK